MPILVTCKCGKKFRADEKHAGKQKSCPKCGQSLDIAGPQVSAYDVFVSYSSKDKTTCDALCATFENKGIRCWIAPRDILPGANWGEAIIRGIEQCQVMVLVFSAHSNESPQVKREVERAVSKGIPVIPLRIEDVKLSRAMEYFISSQHWLDALTPPLENHLEELARKVIRLLTDDDSSSSAPSRSGPDPISTALAVPESKMAVTSSVEPVHPTLSPNHQSTLATGSPESTRTATRQSTSWSRIPLPWRWTAGWTYVLVGALAIGLILWSFGQYSKPSPATVRKKPNVAPSLLSAPFSSTEATSSQSAWAEYLGTEVTTRNDVGMRFSLIPPGEFMMGSPESELGHTGKHEDDEVLHPVRLTQPFLLCQTEVTKGQFAAFVQDAGYESEAEKDGNGGYGYEKNSDGAFEWKQDPKFTWKQPGFTQRDEEPVVNVSWNDACDYCNWLSKKEGVPEFYRTGVGSVSVQGGSGYRLPTEAEWEYACRAGSKSAFQFGDDAEGMERVGNVADASSKAKYNWSEAITADDGYANTSPIGSFRANGFGLFDMHGNVWEWCWDVYVENGSSSATDPDGASTGSLRVRRGGSWNNGPRRSARRKWDDQSYRDYGLGFRVASSPFAQDK